MITTLFFEFGEVSVFSNYVIAIMKEGVTVKPEYNDELIKISDTYFPNRPFGYITYRKNSYAVNPMIYLQTSNIKNLIGFAIVSEDKSKIMNIELEKMFLKKPLQHFKKLDEAKDWINQLVEQYSLH